MIKIKRKKKTYIYHSRNFTLFTSKDLTFKRNSLHVQAWWSIIINQEDKVVDCQSADPSWFGPLLLADASRVMPVRPWFCFPFWERRPFRVFDNNISQRTKLSSRSNSSQVAETSTRTNGYQKLILCQFFCPRHRSTSSAALQNISEDCTVCLWHIKIFYVNSSGISFWGLHCLSLGCH
jgi:hypothetical protein